MENSEPLIITVTNLVTLGSITASFHQIAQQSPGEEPLYESLSDFNADNIREIWKNTHWNIAHAVHELEAKIWQEGHDAGVHNTIHAASIERGNEKPETNPYKKEN